MTLPNPLQESLNVKIKKLEETRTMPLLSKMELKGIEQGKEIGKKIGSLEKARQAVKRVLEIRFWEVFSEVGEALVQVSNHIREFLPPDLLKRQLQLIEQDLVTGELQVYEHQVFKNGQTAYEEIRILAN